MGNQLSGGSDHPSFALMAQMDSKDPRKASLNPSSKGLQPSHPTTPCQTHSRCQGLLSPQLKAAETEINSGEKPGAGRLRAAHSSRWRLMRHRRKSPVSRHAARWDRALCRQAPLIQLGHEAGDTPTPDSPSVRVWKHILPLYLP